MDAAHDNDTADPATEAANPPGTDGAVESTGPESEKLNVNTGRCDAAACRDHSHRLSDPVPSIANVVEPTTPANSDASNATSYAVFTAGADNVPNTGPDTTGRFAYNVPDSDHESEARRTRSTFTEPADAIVVVRTRNDAPDNTFPDGAAGNTNRNTAVFTGVPYTPNDALNPLSTDGDDDDVYVSATSTTATCVSAACAGAVRSAANRAATIVATRVRASVI